MARPPDVARINISGTIAGGGDWATGFWTSGATSADTVMGVVHDPVVTMLNAIRANWSTAFTATTISVYYYATSGGGASSIATSTISELGNSSANGAPLTCCAVATLSTGRPGRQYRGRMYLPWQSPVAPGGHLISAGDIDSAAGAVATCFGTIQGAASGIVPSVVSTVHGTTARITAIRMDDLPDTQRRRERGLSAIHVANQPVGGA